MRAALDDAGVAAEEVDHINAHAASTPAGDLAESTAIRLIYGERAASIPVTSMKGALGHCMGASGALETIAAVLNPAETKALYFVADGTGGHIFADTLAEHNANVAKWYAIRRARGEM